MTRVIWYVEIVIQERNRILKLINLLKKSGIWRVPVSCRCRQNEIKQEERREEKRKLVMCIEQLQRAGISDRKYIQFTFQNDNLKNKKYSEICRKYVLEWETMKNENMGILFSGTVGTGKTFLACCIANALLEQLVPVCITNFPRMLNNIGKLGNDERQGFIDNLQKYDLLVIDDLGVERDTSYSAEQIYNVIDTRIRSNRPTIITTNLSIEDMEKTNNMQYHRIYDRVLEMCPIRLIITGQSYRVQNAAKKRKKALTILWGDD